MDDEGLLTLLRRFTFYKLVLSINRNLQTLFKIALLLLPNIKALGVTFLSNHTLSNIGCDWKTVVFTTGLDYELSQVWTWTEILNNIAVIIKRLRIRLRINFVSPNIRICYGAIMLLIETWSHFFRHTRVPGLEQYQTLAVTQSRNCQIYLLHIHCNTKPRSTGKLAHLTLTLTSFMAIRHYTVAVT